MNVTYIDHMGTDLSVVNAARVSFDNESEWEPCADHWGYGECPNCNSLSDKDTKLIKYLASHDHWTPFAHTAISVRVKAPIFVRTQCFKHKVGLVENEVSRRYIDSEPEFYVPEVWRGRAEDKKQGSSGVIHNVGSYDPGALLEDYNGLLELGVAPEQARMVLPQSMYTEWIWTGNLVSFANFYKKRSASDAQWEVQQIANQFPEIIEPLFPVSWKELTK